MDSSQIILIDKPKGITSFDVIRILRKKLGIRKMGHSGTLDPLATGLLIIGIGQGTKLLTNLIALPKTYEADIRFGIRTDTGDITGTMLEEKIVPALSKSDISNALRELIGSHMLRVPIFSAIKKSGKPLYAYARSGKTIEVPLKEMKIHSTRLIDFDGTVAKVFFEVSSGTYIRTLAETLAERLSTVATIENLRRLSIGPYSIADARTVEEI